MAREDEAVVMPRMVFASQWNSWEGKMTGLTWRTVTLFRMSGKVSRRRPDVKIIITARCNVLFHSAAHEHPSLRQCYAMPTAVSWRRRNNPEPKRC